MFFTIGASNGVAIYEQIVRQVKYAIAEGALTSGQLLPSARTLSVDLAINPNTVVRAFQQLQSEGVLESIRGRGLAVRSGAEQLCKEMRNELVEDRLRCAVREAIQGGLSSEQILAMVGRLLHELSGMQAAGKQSLLEDNSREKSENARQPIGSENSA